MNNPIRITLFKKKKKKGGKGGKHSYGHNNGETNTELKDIIFNIKYLSFLEFQTHCMYYE